MVSSSCTPNQRPSHENYQLITFQTVFINNFFLTIYSFSENFFVSYSYALCMLDTSLYSPKSHHEYLQGEYHNFSHVNCSHLYLVINIADEFTVPSKITQAIQGENPFCSKSILFVCLEYPKSPWQPTYHHDNNLMFVRMKLFLQKEKSYFF